jgi:Ca2+-binding RTX toxin-like protein
MHKRMAMLGACVLALVFVVAGVASAATFVGDEWPNTIHGSPYNDTLYGLDREDTLYGGAKDDKLYGGQGPDVLRGGYGDDYINGGRGYDTLIGGPDHDTIEAYDLRPDTIKCGGGVDRVTADTKDRVFNNCEWVNGEKN